METCDSVFLLLFGPAPREKGTGIILPAWLKVTLYLDQHNEQSSAHALLGDRQHTATCTVFYNFTKLFVRVSGWSWPKLHQLHLIISKQQINNSMMDIVSYSQPQLRTIQKAQLFPPAKTVCLKFTRLVFTFFYICLFITGCVYTHATRHVWRSKDNLQVLVCSFNYGVLVVEFRSWGLATSLPQHLHEVT